MTAPKSTLRPRRSTGSNAVPEELLRWFSGELVETPWTALLDPDYALLPERWRAWAAAHPGASPPAGYEWIARESNLPNQPKGIT